MQNNKKLKIYNPKIKLNELENYDIEKLSYFEYLIDTNISEEEERRKSYETKNIAILSTVGIILSILFFLLPFSYEKLIDVNDKLWIKILLIIILLLILIFIIIIFIKSIKGIISKVYEEIEINKLFWEKEENIINIKRKILKEKIKNCIDNRRTNNIKANYFNESIELLIVLFVLLVLLCFIILYKLETVNNFV